MIQLVLRETVHNLRLWLAAGPLLALTAGMLTIVFSLRSLDESLAEEELGLMDQYDATLLALILLASLGATAVAVYQAALRTRRRTGYIVIGGLNPSGAAAMFTQQVLGICVVATVVGIAGGWAGAPQASQFIAWASSGRSDLTGHTDTHAIVGAG
ncbi:MAG: hypothetical protein LBO75_01005, partial [Bifidobacteriaceae bacterium]|nr:hypothetical protein [Bifidobacteriaceae bacterium]